MSVNRRLLHIGMPRTASTFFQKEVFPNLNDFNHLGVNQTHYSNAFQRLLYQDESRYNETEVKASLDWLEGENLVISNELFVGQSLFMASTNRTRNARRLKKLFPKAEVVLFLRNQADLLESLYSIGVYSGYTVKPEEYIRFDNEPMDSTNPLYPTFTTMEQTEQYFYSYLLRIYQDLFDKVHVFLYEDFTANPSEFIQQFCRKLDLQLRENIDFLKRANSSLSARQLEYLRKTNSLKEVFENSGAGKRIFRKNIQTIERRVGGKTKFHFSPALRKKIKDHFIDDNLTLKELIGESGESDNFERYYLKRI